MLAVDNKGTSNSSIVFNSGFFWLINTPKIGFLSESLELYVDVFSVVIFSFAKVSSKNLDFLELKFSFETFTKSRRLIFGFSGSLVDRPDTLEIM